MASLAQWDDLNDAWHRDRLIAGIALGVGIATSIGAVTRFIWVGRKQPTTIRATTRGDGATVVLEGTW